MHFNVDDGHLREDVDCGVVLWPQFSGEGLLGAVGACMFRFIFVTKNE